MPLKLATLELLNFFLLIFVLLLLSQPDFHLLTEGLKHVRTTSGFLYAGKKMKKISTF